MEIITSECSRDFSGGTAVALGNFDGLHIGHKAIINRILRFAQSGVFSLVYTFKEHPAHSLGGDVELITPLEIKSGLLEEMGVDFMYLEDFSPQFMELTPEEFVQGVLKERLRARFVCAGFNYRFGRGGRGDSSLLKELCEGAGISCEIQDAVTADGVPVSSTAIRDAIRRGDMDAARQYLGRDFFIKGPVVKGRGMGRVLGFPTANILPPREMVIPKSGVYATLTEAAGKSLYSVTNIGTAPTFGCVKKTVETHLIGYKGDLYGHELKVSFLKRLRSERKFGSAAELRLQLVRDLEDAAGYFNRLVRA